MTQSAEDYGAALPRQPRRERLHHARAAARGVERGEQQFPPRKTSPRQVPRFLVPAGTRCAVTRVDRVDWRMHTTVKTTGFERYERAVKTETGLSYEFREAGWLMRVAARLVKHRGFTGAPLRC
jgi:hypothetical protein